MITIADTIAQANTLLDGAPDGAPLDALTRSLIALGLRASVTTLDGEGMRPAMADAFSAGASAIQIQEVIALVSGLGVHSLMVTALPLYEAAVLRGEISPGPLDAERQTLWDTHVGEDPYWDAFEAEMPGFLDALLRMSPAGFKGFFDYCAIPWAENTVRARAKELIALACDACPSHRFLPGLRLHIRNALKLGVGAVAIRETLALAAAAPTHKGVG